MLIKENHIINLIPYQTFFLQALFHALRFSSPEEYCVRLEYKNKMINTN
jgi:hypothetical protein